MTKDVSMGEWERTCQVFGGSKGIIVPAEVVEDLGLTESDMVVVRRYYRYAKDRNGNILSDKEGKPVIERKYCSFWKKGE